MVFDRTKTLSPCFIRINEVFYFFGGGSRKEMTQEGFEKALKKWYFWATHSRIEEIKEAAKTVKRHWFGVLRWYVSRINNGILEGLNSLVQAAKAKARGYRTFKNLKTIIYMLTGKLDYTKVGLPTWSEK
jgi:hypothetical protein